MKKRFIAILMLIVLAAAMLPTLALADSVRYVYTRNGKSLNLRSAPISHANNRIGYIPNGAKVTVKEYVNSRTWAYVNYNGTYGYVMTRYLVTEKPKNTSGSSSSSTTDKNKYAGFVETDCQVVVTASTPGGFVNLRWGPSKEDAIMTRLNDGQLLTAVAMNRSWAQVRIPETGQVGFVMLQFIRNAD